MQLLNSQMGADRLLKSHLRIDADNIGPFDDTNIKGNAEISRDTGRYLHIAVTFQNLKKIGDTSIHREIIDMYLKCISINDRTHTFLPTSFLLPAWDVLIRLSTSSEAVIVIVGTRNACILPGYHYDVHLQIRSLLDVLDSFCNLLGHVNYTCTYS